MEKDKEQKTTDLPNEGQSEAKSDVQQLINTVKQQAKDIELLKSVADKKALSQYYLRNQGKIPLKVKLRIINDKVIVGWRTVKDVSEFDNQSRRFIVDQRVELVNEDATKEEMSLIDFNRHYTYIECEQIGKEETGNALILKLKNLENGKIYKVDVRFVN
jgi:hypothetical protein